MACRLFGAKPLSKRTLMYCQLATLEQNSVKFESKYKIFHSRNCIWKCRLGKWRPFCPGGDELRFDNERCRQGCYMIPCNHCPNMQDQLCVMNLSTFAMDNTAEHWNENVFWRNFNHWLHWKLSFWQHPVQLVMKISWKWQLFCFSEWDK